MYGIIYCATNNTNNKKYIGQTVKTLNYRRRQHENIAIQNKHHNLYFQNALLKNKLDFSWEVLEECNSKEELNEREIYYIKKYKARGKKGYNLAIGGGVVRKIELTKTQIDFIITKRREFISRPQILKLFNEKFQKQLKGVNTIVITINNFLSHEEEKKITYIIKSKNSKSRVETEQSKLNRSKSQLGKKHSKETLEKLKTNRLGKKHTRESREKVSTNNKRKIVFTQEEKQFIFNCIKIQNYSIHKTVKMVNEKYNYNINVSSACVINRVLNELDSSHYYAPRKYVYVPKK